jgi:hypothetical protein
MGSYIVKNCKDCNEIEGLQKDISFAIYDLTQKLYFKVTYLADKAVCKQKLKDLIYYKDIINRMSFNSATFECAATRKEIISHVKKLLY